MYCKLCCIILCAECNITFSLVPIMSLMNEDDSDDAYYDIFLIGIIVLFILNYMY